MRSPLSFVTPIVSTLLCIALLNDPAPAGPHLCACIAVEHTMRKDDQKLLKNLLADAGRVECPGSGAVPQPRRKHP